MPETVLPGQCGGPINGGCGSGNDDLARRVVVADFQHVAVGGRSDERVGGREVAADEGRHPAFADGDCRLHGPSAPPDQPHGVRKWKCACSGKRGVLAQGMTGHVLGGAGDAHRALTLHHAQQGQGMGQQRWLREFGSGEVGFRSLEGESRQRERQRVIDLFPGFGGGREGIPHCAPHSGRLRSLAGKNERACS